MARCLRCMEIESPRVGGKQLCPNQKQSDTREAPSPASPLLSIPTLFNPINPISMLRDICVSMLCRVSCTTRMTHNWTSASIRVTVNKQTLQIITDLLFQYVLLICQTKHVIWIQVYYVKFVLYPKSQPCGRTTPILFVSCIYQFK